MSVFQKINRAECSTDIISGLEDRPQMAPQELKAMFDKGAANVKQAVNTAIDEINQNIDALNDLIVNETGTSETKVMSQKAVTDAISDIVLESGTGDMSKAVYDKNSSGTVDNAEALGGKTLGEIMLLMNPVGTVKITTTNINPSTYLGGVWERWGEGRFPLSMGSPEQNDVTYFGTLSTSDLTNNFTLPEEKGGAYLHKLTVAQMPSHYHTLTTCPGRDEGTEWVGAPGYGANVSRNTNNVGGSASHNNMPPYITCYMWKRTA